jgi:hypothetical protein
MATVIATTRRAARDRPGVKRATQGEAVAVPATPSAGSVQDRLDEAFLRRYIDYFLDDVPPLPPNG